MTTETRPIWVPIKSREQVLLGWAVEILTALLQEPAQRSEAQAFIKAMESDEAMRAFVYEFKPELKAIVD